MPPGALSRMMRHRGITWRTERDGVGGGIECLRAVKTTTPIAIDDIARPDTGLVGAMSRLTRFAFRHWYPMLDTIARVQDDPISIRQA